MENENPKMEPLNTNQPELRPDVIAKVETVLPPKTEIGLELVYKEVQELKAQLKILEKMEKQITTIKTHVDYLVAVETWRAYPSWKNKIINVLVALFHVTPEQSEKERTLRKF